ncbi:hypothetical protein PM8797T_14344 [Gimesia maris DSM 8797]|nr:hypothetical protein PM8797T_14344 [Gimesia maris DSM 8797]
MRNSVFVNITCGPKVQEVLIRCLFRRVEIRIETVARPHTVKNAEFDRGKDIIGV